MRLLVDMNLAPRWAVWLAAAGIGAVHWSEVGNVGATDSEVMRYAAVHGFIVLTHDLDFGTILAATSDRKPSVVQVRADNVTPEALGDLVIAALRRTEPELTDGALLTVEPSRSRLRLLPFPPSAK